MRERSTFIAGLAGLCLLVVPLASCAAEPGAGPSGPTATATAGRAPVVVPPSVAAPTALPVPSPTTPPSAEPSPTAVPLTTHTVRPGDTLLGLATKYGVSMAAIQLQNGMGDSTVLRVGDVLSVPPQAAWEGASPFWIVHVVREGQTLIGIAGMYGLSPERLQAVNGLTDADRLAIGQELVLPLDAPRVAVLPTPTPTPIPSPTVATPAPVPPALPPASPPAGTAAWPHEVARLINEVRAANGLAAFSYNETLAAAAQAHAADCAQRGWCSHTGSDGSDAKARIVRAGYDASGWAECWVQAQTPHQAVEWWMDEVPPDDAHRRTLLSTWVSEVGVGLAETTWGYYIIADFGRP